MKLTKNCKNKKHPDHCNFVIKTDSRALRTNVNSLSGPKFKNDHSVRDTRTDAHGLKKSNFAVKKAKKLLKIAKTAFFLAKTVVLVPTHQTRNQ